MASRRGILASWKLMRTAGLPYPPGWPSDGPGKDEVAGWMALLRNLEDNELLLGTERYLSEAPEWWPRTPAVLAKAAATAVAQQHSLTVHVPLDVAPNAWNELHGIDPDGAIDLMDQAHDVFASMSWEHMACGGCGSVGCSACRAAVLHMSNEMAAGLLPARPELRLIEGVS